MGKFYLWECPLVFVGVLGSLSAWISQILFNITLSLLSIIHHRSFIYPSLIILILSSPMLSSVHCIVLLILVESGTSIITLSVLPVITISFMNSLLSTPITYTHYSPSISLFTSTYFLSQLVYFYYLIHAASTHLLIWVLLTLLCFLSIPSCLEWEEKKENKNITK